MTLRVGHVLNAPGYGGVPQVAHALIRASNPRRVTPHLFHLKPGRQVNLPDCPCASASGAGGKSGAIVDLLDWLVAYRIDVLHCHSFRPNLYARQAGAVLRPGLHIVAHYHNTYDDKWSDPQALALERHLGRVTDARIAVSAAVADHVAGRLDTDRAGIDVVANAVDTARLAGGDRARGRAVLGVSSDAPLVGLVGRICRQKGQDTFVEAALILLQDNPALRFVIVGDPEDQPLTDRLRNRIAACGQVEAIRLVGHCDAIGDVLAALDVLAAPSRWEGFGLALLEAMWCGVPVVASAVGAIPSVTAGTARLVPPDDPIALAGAMRDAIAAPSPGTIDAARRIASGSDWHHAALQIEAIYERIMP